MSTETVGRVLVCLPACVALSSREPGIVLVVGVLVGWWWLEAFRRFWWFHFRFERASKSQRAFEEKVRVTPHDVPNSWTTLNLGHHFAFWLASAFD
jgi:hypothetical protein